MAQTGQLVKEEVTIVFSFVFDEETINQYHNEIIEYGRSCAREWSQEAVLVNIDNDVNFLEG